MDVLTEAAREFWRGMLAAGGFTAMPRWSLDPIAGVAVHDAMIREDLKAACAGWPTSWTYRSVRCCWLAHAKVLSALSGERHVTTGYVGGTGPEPLPCRLTTEADSWRELLLDTHRVEGQLLSHADFPLDELRGELGVTGPAFETVFDPTGVDGDLSVDTVLRLGIAPRGDELVLRLRYRTEVLDADCAARIAGYHLTALELIAADPDAEHRGQSLLSAEELHFQLEGLAGRRRELPDARVHELFEQRVRAHPDARRRGVRRVAASRMGSSMSVPTGWRGRCWRGGWAVRVWWRWWRSAIWIGWPPCSRFSRLVGCICRSSRISRLIVLRRCCLGPNADLVLTEPGSTATLDQALDVVARGSDAFHRRRATGRIMPTAISASRSRRISWPISISRPVRLVSRRVRCVSTPAC